MPAKKKEPQVIEESAIVRTPAKQTIPAVWEPPEEPSWDRARTLVDVVRQSVTAVIELGMEIQALRDAYFAQGARTDALGRISINGSVNKGWQQVVQEE